MLVVVPLYLRRGRRGAPLWAESGDANCDICDVYIYARGLCVYTTTQMCVCVCLHVSTFCSNPMLHLCAVIFVACVPSHVYGHEGISGCLFPVVWPAWGFSRLWGLENIISVGVFWLDDGAVRLK